MIRKAAVEDLSKLEPGAREFFASSKFLKRFDPDRFASVWQQLFASGAGVVFLAEDEAGTVTGAIGGIRYPDLCSGDLIASEMFWFTRPEHRGDGMRLYRWFEAWALEQGCSEIRMVHLADSMPERLDTLYRRLGYEPAEVHYTKELRP